MTGTTSINGGKAMLNFALNPPIQRNYLKMSDDEQQYNLPPKTIAGLLLCRIVIICALGLFAITSIIIFAPQTKDMQIILTLIFGFLSTIIIQMLNLAKSRENAYAIKQHAEMATNKLDTISNGIVEASRKAEVAANNAVIAAKQTSQTLDAISHPIKDGA